MAIKQTYVLDMIQGGRTLIIPVSQYDNGARELILCLTAGANTYTIPDGATVTVRGTKPDRHGFAHTCQHYGSVAMVILTRNMTAVPGDTWCELRITTGADNDEIVGSANFILRVEPAGLADDTDISTTEIPAIEDAARANAERAEAAAERAEKAASGSGGGASGVSPTVEFSAIDGGTRLTITDKDGAHTADIMNGAKGDTGAQGPQGETGATGADGISPTVTAAQTDTGATITITDRDGAHTIALSNGKDGANGSAGTDGKDGVSPIVSFTAIDGGTRITITDASGAHTADIQNGATGPQGATGATGSAGADGYSPTVEIAEIDGGKRITITDKNGAHTADIMNGATGETGAAGPAYTLTDDDKTAIVTAVLAQMTNAETEAL
ncbi:hypothetical protein [Galactobacillus timonensis]|uniref:hypothetical protein n=1 Tax=Galactobacillus timonensis TaxID=2041840 RepID=UPI000C82ABBC|nr:hypothetical protein [Galactobacillus timonensis]